MVLLSLEGRKLALEAGKMWILSATDSTISYLPHRFVVSARANTCKVCSMVQDVGYMTAFIFVIKELNA